MKKIQAVDKTESASTYSRLGFISALIIVVFVPLIFIPSLTYSTFAIWKVNAFIIAVLGLALAWLLKCRAENEVTLKIPYFVTPLLLFAVIQVLATLFSVDRYESVFGTYDRFEGLLAIIGYLLVALIIPSVIGRKEIDRIISAWLVVGALISAYGLLQYIGIDFRDWQAAYVDRRVFSTLGNPLILSGYIVLTLPIAYMRLISHRDIASAAFILLGIPALLVTYSRSGWLAFIIITLFFIAFVIKHLMKDRLLQIPRSSFLWAFLALVIIVAVIISSTGDFGSRITSAYDWKSGSAAARLNLWKLTVNIISERPFFGYGPETFLEVSNRFLDLTQQYIEVNTRYDRPHNDMLQVAFSTGFIGLLAYLFLLSTYFLRVLRFLRKNDRQDDAYIVASLALGVLGYLITIQFFFSTVLVTPLMWLSIGLTAVFVGADKKMLRLNISGLVIPAIIGLSALLLVPHLMTLVSDSASKQAIKAREGGDRLGAIDRAALAARISPWQVEYLLRQGEELDKYGDLDGAISVYKRVTEVSPGRYDGYAYLASIYYERGEYSDAVNYALEALKRYPLHYESRMIYALVSIIDGDHDVAEENLLKLQKVDPNDYRAFMYLGFFYQDTGSPEAAKDQLKKALALSPDNPSIRQALADLDIQDK